MPEQRNVGKYYRKVLDEYGPVVAREFYILMKKWADEPDLFNSFYDEDVLKNKLKEAKEICLK